MGRKKCDDTCVPRECSPKSSLSREDFNNEVERMTCSLESSQSLSPVNPVVGHEQSGHGDREGYFYSPRVTWLWLLLSAQYGANPQGDQPVTWWQADYLRLLPLRKGERFILTRIDTMDMDLLSPPWAASAKTTICGPTKCFMRCHGILHSAASNQVTHFTAKEVQEWAHAHGIHWSYQVLHYLGAAGLIE